MYTKASDLAVGDSITLIRYSSFGTTSTISNGGLVTKITKTRVITEFTVDRNGEKVVITNRWVIKTDGTIRNREGHSEYSESHFYKTEDPQVAKAQASNEMQKLRNATIGAANAFAGKRYPTISDIDELIMQLHVLRGSIVEAGAE